VQRKNAQVAATVEDLEGIKVAKIRPHEHIAQTEQTPGAKVTAESEKHGDAKAAQHEIKSAHVMMQHHNGDGDGAERIELRSVRCLGGGVDGSSDGGMDRLLV